MSISKLGAVARAAYYSDHKPGVNEWDAVAEAVSAEIATAAREVIRDYQASGDVDLDALVKRSIHDLAARFGIWIDLEA